MGKSESNFIFVHDAVQQYAPEAIRHFLISAQYRHPLDYNSTSLSESSSAVRRLSNCLDALKPYQDVDGDASEALNDAEAARILQSIDTMLHDFELAMDDDFNTAGALGAIFKFVGEVNQFLAMTGDQPSNRKGNVLSQAYKNLVKVCNVLGIYAEEDVASDEQAALTAQLMDLILEVRQEARERKDWETADKIRNQLEQLNVELQDSRTGTTWKIIKGEKG